MATKKKRTRKKKPREEPATSISMASRIEVWELRDLVPYDRNPRTHSEAQIRDLVASIQRFGFTAPILVDRDHGILAGHGRFLAAQSLGLAEVPVIPLDHLSEADRRAYVIADNRLAEGSGWDEGLLRRELAELDALGAADALGFSEEEIRLATDGLELPIEPPAELFEGAAVDGSADDGDPLGELSDRHFGASTALSRGNVPAKFWKDRGDLRGHVLDFGCGRWIEPDVARWDPFHAPDPRPLLATYQTVVCSYVLNVQPTDHLVSQILVILNRLLSVRGRALIAVRNDIDPGRNHTSKGFQVGKSLGEWSALIAQFFDAELVEEARFFGWSGKPLREKNETPATTPRPREPQIQKDPPEG